jgi:cysteinyl-tRNA synthetase
MLQIFDTMARKMIPFLPTDPNNVLVYQCGPTPYDYAHIGNLRTYIFEDIVTRSLRFLGYTVHVSMNITDIDDKTIRRSGERGIPLLKHTKEFTDAFLEDLSTLGIQLPEKIVPISTLIPEMVTIIN